MKIAIVDCGSGNLQSVKNALDYLGINNEITLDKAFIQKADLVIFPGQGHFGAVMQHLDQMGIRELICDCAKNKPFLGICVGMQVLFQGSDEAPGIQGLGLFSGTVKKFPSSQKTPQMGWNRVDFLTPNPFSTHSQYFYFAHSYYCEVEDPSLVLAASDYGTTFPSALRHNQLVAVQFHPEKSGEAGLNFLKTVVRTAC